MQRYLSIKRVKYTEKFSSVEDVCTELQSLDAATKDVGYIEPGHGVKGRQMWLETEDDLDEMYQILAGLQSRKPDSLH